MPFSSKKKIALFAGALTMAFETLLTPRRAPTAQLIRALASRGA